MINKKEEDKIEVLRRKENKGILMDVPISMIFEIVCLWSEEICPSQTRSLCGWYWELGT